MSKISIQNFKNRLNKEKLYFYWDTLHYSLLKHWLLSPCELISQNTSISTTRWSITQKTSQNQVTFIAFNVDYKILLLHIAVCLLTERNMYPQIYEQRDAIALFLEHQGKKNQLLQTFKKINSKRAWSIWQIQLKLWIQWIQNFKDQEQHHFYYIVF